MFAGVVYIVLGIALFCIVDYFKKKKRGENMLFIPRKTPKEILDTLYICKTIVLENPKHFYLFDNIPVAEMINEVQCRISNERIARQFVLEEIEAMADGAKSNNKMAAKFVQLSTFKSYEYENAMANSFPLVDGPNGPQQKLKVMIAMLRVAYSMDNKEGMKTAYLVEPSPEIADFMLKESINFKYDEVKMYISLVTSIMIVEYTMKRFGLGLYSD